MSKKDRLSGNEAAAVAIRQIDPDVVAAFPITPSTEIPQYVSMFQANGELTSEFVAVESEHSAISACVGAQAAGVRAMTATSSCGLALMHEILYVASSSRLPIVMAVVNRALSAPININNDHSDSMGSRDSGWIQLYSESAQEAYDNMLMANRIAEHKDVQLPIMICQDGFITSHAVENIVLEDDEFAKKFVGQYKPEKYMLNPKESLSVGPYDISSYYMEHKYQQTEALRESIKVIREVSAAYGKATGRTYDLIEKYKMEDAEYALMAIGSSAGTGKAAVDVLRAQGKKVGLIKVRCFNPFPVDDIIEAVKNVKVLGLMDKTDSFNGFGGPLGALVRAAMYGKCDGIKTINYVYGLGGRDVSVDTFYGAYAELEEIAKGKEVPAYRYLDTRI